MQEKGGLISEVLPDSIGEELGIEPGDVLLAINEEPVTDLIDYNYHCADDCLLLSIKKPSGEIWECEVEKWPDEDLGLVFSANVFDRVRPCHNHCLFCFIDQLPPHPRKSLLLKDDDYRMSFLEGNYITCTNMTEEDYTRIGEMHLSPLYVSVHSVDPLLRQKLLGRKEPAEILLTLQRLIAMGCEIHTQIVLCPGLNDGAELERTLDALAGLRPGVLSVAVVPVGLTRYQKHEELRLFTPEEAREVIRQIEIRQQRYLAETGNAFVYPSDEFYLKAGLPFPQAEIYGEFAQIEDGVGMAALFQKEWAACRANIPHKKAEGRICLVAGVSGAPVIQEAVEEIKQVSGSDLTLLTVKNTFFGETITVTGLLTASCLLKAIQPGEYDRIVIPDNMLRFTEDVFLDNVTVEELAQRLETPVTVVDCQAQSLLDGIFETEEPYV